MRIKERGKWYRQRSRVKQSILGQSGCRSQQIKPLLLTRVDTSPKCETNRALLNFDQRLAEYSGTDMIKKIFHLHLTPQERTAKCVNPRDSFTISYHSVLTAFNTKTLNT